ncbi:uncharacterized protein LOC108886116 [Lates calcarifer]|uniref:Uncharacterized protein LOC108886116 n=1 Tax=Lates calcarifer TaxID=8187 RepID=A0AAJ8DUS9_LATCA|nr:uncharacterized protein LOC108886116 [Lates calcarifer]
MLCALMKNQRRQRFDLSASVSPDGCKARGSDVVALKVCLQVPVLHSTAFDILKKHKPQHSFVTFRSKKLNQEYFRAEARKFISFTSEQLKKKGTLLPRLCFSLSSLVSHCRVLPPELESFLLLP